MGSRGVGEGMCMHRRRLGPCRLSDQPIVFGFVSYFRTAPDFKGWLPLTILISFSVKAFRNTVRCIPSTHS